MDPSNNLNTVSGPELMNLMREYIENMNDYQSNMRHLIQLLERTSYAVAYDPISYTTPMTYNVNHSANNNHNTSNLFANNANVDGYTTPPLYFNQTTSSFNQPTTPEPIRRPRTNMNTYSMFPTTIRQHIQGFMEDVVVRPTQLQIDTAIEYITYDPSMNLLETRCPISLEDFAEGEQIMQIRHCRHVFKSSALRDWFSRNVHCPVCRFDIRETPIDLANINVNTANDLEDVNTNDHVNTNVNTNLSRNHATSSPNRANLSRNRATSSTNRTTSSTNHATSSTNHPMINTLSNALHNFIQSEVENNSYINEFMYTFDIPLQGNLFDISGNLNHE
jgi:hypothetical protein